MNIDIMHLARTGPSYRSAVMYQGSIFTAQAATQDGADAKVMAKLRLSPDGGTLF